MLEDLPRVSADEILGFDTSLKFRVRNLCEPKFC
jgi:hypothetical protein